MLGLGVCTAFLEFLLQTRLQIVAVLQPNGEAVGGRRANLDDAAVVELAHKAFVQLGA